MSTEEPVQYLAILKASYDYTPQSDDEIAIKQGQQLLLVEKVDDDWWKVKVTGNEEEADNQIGLVPAAYVEQAPHTSVVKVLYDYEAVAPGELTVHENDILLLFETEEDWLLVQDSRIEGRAGFVPGNYVEVVDEDEAKESTQIPNRIIVPDSPPRSAYVDPADMVASIKVTADDIRTWSVSEVDKKGKKKKGTLGIGNGSLFFASESDKTPVQKWDIKDVLAASSEKAKHVKVDIGGSSPANLHFHTSSREHVDAILEKLRTSRALFKLPQDPESLTVETLSSPTKKPSVHFSPAAPTVIPNPEELEEEPPIENGEHVEMVLALYDFNADGEDELTVKEGERLIVLEKDGEEWWKCKNVQGVEGVVPASYLEVVEHSEALANEDVGTGERHAEEERLQKQQEEENLERERRREHEREEESRRKKNPAPTVKAEAQSKLKDVAGTAQSEQAKRKMAVPATSRPEPSQPSVDSRASSDINRPSPENTRTWHDRTGQFRVEAAFLGFNNGKLRLHKVNGVIVEVPSEKMSLDDMRYVEKLMEKKKKTPTVNHGVSDDDIPLALARNVKTTPKATNSSKKSHQVDWFDFFLSAGCEVDDCTRYAAAFERDKMDETLLNDITEGTMRSLGLREGDIIRVKKAIEKRKPTDNLQKTSSHLQEQILRDEELARQLQAQENTWTPAPNLFAGPGGVLKPRRGRPQPSKSLPPTNVDLSAISSASGQIKSDESPRIGTSSPLPLRPTSAGATATTNGFEDDAWTNRPNSAKPVKSTSPGAAASSAISSPSVPSALVPTPTPTSPPNAKPSQTVRGSTQDDKVPPSLTKTSEADIFDQLARLSDLRKNPTPQAPQQTAPKSTVIQPHGYQSGMGMGPSPLSLAQIGNSTIAPNLTSHGPRGPYAPVPANQGLLQPLIPTQTGFGGFIPTKPTQSPSPFQSQLSAPSFIPPQTTGFQNATPITTRPTGAFGNFTTDNYVSIPGLALTSQPTGLNSQITQSPFSNPGGQVPPSLSNSVKDTSPASVFAQMKLGTFANEDNPNGLNGQTTSWGHQPYQAYTGH